MGDWGGGRKIVAPSNHVFIWLAAGYVRRIRRLNTAIKNEYGKAINGTRVILDHASRVLSTSISASIGLFNGEGRYGAEDLGSADPSGGGRNPGATRHPD